MGKQSGKKKKGEGGPLGDSNIQRKVGNNSLEVNEKDAEVFISMSKELKEEGNRLFQKRDCEGALMKYEKAIKLLTRNHIDVSYLRSNMAACYMQMGVSEYSRAIRECDLAVEVTPKYGIALLKRAKCYEGLNKLDLALRDVNMVLKIEPNNVTALEVSERVTKALEQKGLRVNDSVIELPPDYIEPPSTSTKPKTTKEKMQKKKHKKVEENKAGDEVKETKIDNKIEEKKVDDHTPDKKTHDKVVVEEKINGTMEVPKKTIKLVFGEDIRVTQLPRDFGLQQLRKVIFDRFPITGVVLIKYKDQEGDFVTVTSDEELRWAKASAESQSSIRLYLVKVSPQQDPFYKQPEEEEVNKMDIVQSMPIENRSISKGMHIGDGCSFIDEWIVEFAKVFKDHVGFESDVYLGLHELGVEVYSEAMDDAATSVEARDFFNRAAGKFQEMAHLALFNWGNVYMSRARKRVYFTKDSSRESLLEQIKIAYDWAQKTYLEAGHKFEAALRIKPDFYEGLLALGQQQFEQAKLSWYHAAANNIDLESWDSEEVIQLYNMAGNNMERGMQMFEESEVQCQSELSNLIKVRSQSERVGLDGLFKDISVEEAAEQTKDMMSQINLLWGTILYERSMMEFKLGLPFWHESLGVAFKKFELAGASPTDITIMIKNHVLNDNTLDGLGFNTDEIVQSWNKRQQAKRWLSGISSLRLEPLLQRRVSKLYDALELA